MKNTPQSLPAKADRNQTIAEKYAAGVSGIKLAAEYGICRERVYQILQMAGVLIRDGNTTRLPISGDKLLEATKLVQRGVPVAHVADELGIKRATLYARLRHLGVVVPSIEHREWTPAEDAVLAAHYKRDKSAREIAAKLYRTTNEVIGRAHRRGFAKALLEAVE